MNTKKKNNEEIKINRSAMYATWANTMIALLALGCSIYAVWLTRKGQKDNFQVIYARDVYDAPLQIIEQPSVDTDVTTGIIETYFEFYLSNNGENNVSIINHDITEITDEYDTNKPIQYFPTQNTYYMRKDGAFIPYDYPLVVGSGDAQRIYTPVELILAPKAYSLIKEKFGDQVKSELTLETIQYFLFSQNIDLYGNTVEHRADGSSNILITHEQTFLISFTSSRKVEGKYLFSLYALNDLYFMPAP